MCLVETSRRIIRVTLALLLLAVSFAASAKADETTGGSGSGDPPPPATSLPLPTIDHVAPLDVVRGSRVVVTATDLPKKASEIRLWLGDVEIGQPADFVPGGLAFIVPKQVGVDPNAVQIPFGEALVKVQVLRDKRWSEPIAAEDISAGYIHIAPEVKPPGLSLTRVEPSFIPIHAEHLVLIGEGMDGNVEDYALLLDDREVKLCAEACKGGLVARFTSPRQVEVDGPFRKEWIGSRKLGLRSGDVATKSAAPVRFMPYDIKQTTSIALWWSVGIVGLLLVIVLLGPGTYSIDSKGLVEKPQQRLGVFLLDRNTDTYSLSALQFYLWTGAAVFAYVYLTASRILCQGVLELADVPENLPGILMVSGSATFLSAGITSQKGPKGAGPVQPSIKDLISSGGVVLPERVQMLAWTVVAIGSFVLAVLRSDPTSITTLPGIPERLLWLSTASAVGYLGGKMARRAGPVIDQIQVSAEKSELTIVGRELDVAASFEIAKASLDNYLSTTPGASVRAIAPVGTADVATQLRLKLVKIEDAWQEPGKPVDLTIINRDGQRATWPLMFKPAPPPPPPAVESAKQDEPA